MKRVVKRVESLSQNYRIPRKRAVVPKTCDREHTTGVGPGDREVCGTSRGRSPAPSMSSEAVGLEGIGQRGRGIAIPRMPGVIPSLLDPERSLLQGAGLLPRAPLHVIPIPPTLTLSEGRPLPLPYDKIEMNEEDCGTGHYVSNEKVALTTVATIVRKLYACRHNFLQENDPEYQVCV